MRRRFDAFVARRPRARLALEVAMAGGCLAICVMAIVDFEALGENRVVYVACAAPILAIWTAGVLLVGLPRWRRRRHALAVAAGYAEAETLGDVLAGLDRRRGRGELVIFAERPWTPRSRALVLDRPELFSYEPPEEAPGFDYFAELKQARYDAQFFPDDPGDGLIRLASQPQRRR